MKTNSELLQIDVQELLPQRPPFVMIDRLVYNDETTTVTEFEVKADNLFAEGDLLNPCALVENIAQTCAVRMGYIDHYINKVHVRLGFIGDVKNLSVLRPAKVGELLVTTIEVVQQVMQVTMVRGTVRVGDEPIVTSTMKIALTDIDAQ